VKAGKAEMTTVQDRIALIWRSKRAEVRDLLKKHPELAYKQIAELQHVSLSFVNVTARMYGIRRYKKVANK
jgi:hypothetical protein